MIRPARRDEVTILPVAMLARRGEVVEAAIKRSRRRCLERARRLLWARSDGVLVSRELRVGASFVSLGPMRLGAVHDT